MQRWNSKFISSSHRLRLLAASGSALFGPRASPESFTCSCLLSQCLQSADSSSAQATEKNLIHISSEVRSTNTSLLQQNIQVPVLYLTVLTLLKKKYIYKSVLSTLFSFMWNAGSSKQSHLCFYRNEEYDACFSITAPPRGSRELLVAHTQPCACFLHAHTSHVNILYTSTSL